MEFSIQIAYEEKIKSLEHKILALEARLQNDKKFNDWTQKLCGELQLEINTLKDEKIANAEDVPKQI